MATTYLTRTAETPTLGTKCTISCWVKRSSTATGEALFSAYTDTNERHVFGFNDRNIILFGKQGGSTNVNLETVAKFQDPSAFYHLVCTIDTTQVTAADRVKIYVNGVQQTAFDQSTYPAQNDILEFQVNNASLSLGAKNHGSFAEYFNGLISYFAFVDGTAYDASYFGETDSSSGIWKIKTAPSVTYGTNGFFLKMDTSSPGTDTSGNSNTFTASGTPTLAQDNASNVFATNNSLCNVAGRWTITNGNNTIQHANGGSWTAMISSIASSVGKYYMEAKITAGASRTMFGVMSADTNIISYETNLTTICLYYNLSGGEFQQSGGTTSGNNYGTFADNDIAGIALDCTNNKISIYKNGTALVTDHTIPATVDGFIGFGFTSDSNSTIYQCNYGNGFFGTTAVASSNADAAGHGLFEYAVPTGYFSLNTKNLNTYG